MTEQTKSAPPPASPPAPKAGAKKEHLKAELPAKFVEGLKAAGKTPKDVLAMRSYDDLKLWRATCSGKTGVRIEVSYDGKWLNDPIKVKAAAEAKKKAAAAKKGK